MLSFHTLKQIASGINRNKIKKISLLNEAGDESNRVNKLYNGLLHEKYQSDDDAAKDIFGTDETNVQYRKLRIKLFDKLVNTAFFIEENASKFPELAKAEHQCYRYFAAANILMSLQINWAATFLIKRIIEPGIKFNLTFLVTEASWYLRTKLKGHLKPKEHTYFTKLHETFEFKRRWEMESEIAFEDFYRYYTKNTTPRKVLFKKYGPLFFKFLEVADSVNTVRFYFNTYRIGCAYYYSINDYHNALELCLIAINKLEKMPAIKEFYLETFVNNALLCYTQLRIFNTPAVNKVLDYCLKLPPENTANKVIAFEMILHHRLHEKNYDAALGIYITAKNMLPSLTKFQGNRRDNWELFGGFFQVLAKLGQINRQKVDDAVGELDSSLIDYAVREIKKEKEGMNIPVVMLPLIIGVLEKQSEGHVRSKDALIQYSKRYLKNQQNKRSSAMLDFLIAVENYQYQQKETLKIIANTLKVFKAVPIELSEQSSMIEVVPYETLLVLICKHYGIPLPTNVDTL